YKPELTQDKDGVDDVATLRFSKPKTKDKVIKRKGIITDVWETPAHFGWAELQQSNVRFCQVPKASAGKIKCSVAARPPHWIDMSGDRSVNPAAKGATDEIWFTESEEKLPGNVYKIRRLETETNKLKPDFLTVPARPLKVVFAGKDIWVLFGERTQRTMRR